MYRRTKRELIESKDYDFIRVERYSTGAVNFIWIDRREILSISNAQGLAEAGYLEKIANLLLDEDASLLIAAYPRGLKLDYVPAKMEEGVKYIIDSELDVDSKLIYLISLIKTRFPLGPDELEVVFAKRPSPREEWTKYASADNMSEKGLIRSALMPGFFLPDTKNRSVENYKRYSLTSAFVYSERGITHEEFMNLHKNDFFIPHLAVNAQPTLFQDVPKTLLADLRPAEFVRFLSYFAQRCSRELLPWAKRRFDEGVITFKEARDKGSAKLQPGNVNGWLQVINLLTVEEAKQFQELLREPNGIGSLASGTDHAIAPLFAYYFAEGGKSKLNELASHIIDNGPGLRRDFYEGMLFKLNWINPYSEAKVFKPRLAPYVKALEEGQKEYPLEWSLASL